MIGENRMSNPLTNAKVTLIGINGNAFSILGTLRKAILKSDHPELVEQFISEATSGNYDHLLATCFKYAEVN
jgi:hypothetical protein